MHRANKNNVQKGKGYATSGQIHFQEINGPTGKQLNHGNVSVADSKQAPHEALPPNWSATKTHTQLRHPGLPTNPNKYKLKDK
eukprot:4488814-Ditylum_brightwellii.AAC.1